MELQLGSVLTECSEPLRVTQVGSLGLKEASLSPTLPWGLQIGPP